MNWWNTLTTTDKIALLALFVSVSSLVSSIAIGLLGLRYTRRSIINAFPWLHIHLTSEINHGHSYLRPTKLFVDARNVGGDSIEDVMISLSIANPLRQWRFWQQKWYLFTTWKIPVLSPGSTLEECLKQPDFVKILYYPDAGNVSIEEFLEIHFPSLVRKEKEAGESIDKYSYLWEASEWYSLSRNIFLEAEVICEYAILGEVRRRTMKTYSLSPILEGGKKTLLQGWKII